jgi:signal transduction histidine kinase
MAMSMTEFVQVERSNLSTEQIQASQIIWKALNRMNDMIGKILDVKAIESNHINLEMEPLDMAEVAERCYISHAERASKKNIRLSFDMKSESRITADGNYLFQVIDNLLSNALKFSQPGSGVYLAIKEKDDRVWFEIRDEGPGISADDMKKLFGKYQKLSARPTGGEQSTGLGLSIVKKYVELMNGKVWCESQPGSGSVFYVSFEKCPEVVT